MQKSHLPSRFSRWLDAVDGRILSSFTKARQAPGRAYRALKKLPPALRIGVGAGSGALSLLAWFLIASLVTTSAVKSLTPEVAEAAGVYTNASTDGYGNTHLAANGVLDTYRYDLSTDSNEATQQQIGVDPNWMNGVTRQSSAVNFDGTNDTISVASTSSITVTAGTVEAWFRTPASSGVDWIVLKDFAYNILVVNGNISVQDPGVGTRDSGVNVVDGLWHHVAVVFSSGITNGTKIYLDGTLVLTTTFTQIGSGVLSIGSNQGSDVFSGQIDEVRISNTARYTSAFSPQRRFVEDPNTMGLWHLDEGTGTTAYDSSGNANTGTLTNGPTWSTGSQAITDGFKGCSPDDATDGACQAGGRTGAGNLTLGSNSSVSNDKAYEVQMVGPSATSFDGSNDYIAIPNSSSLNRSVGATVTMEAWVYPTASVGSWASIIAKRSGGFFAYGINYNNSFGQVQVFTTAGVQTFSYDIPLNTWTYVAGVIDASETRLYINGRLIGSGAGSGVGYSGSDDLVIGAYASGSEPFTGKIDEVRVSSSAKYSAEFFPARRAKVESDTIGLWHLDEGTGTTAYDASGNGNTGTLTNGPTWTAGITRTDPTQGDPLYYKWREVGGSWSTPAPTPSSSTQLASTGVYLRFNQGGIYGDLDTFRIASWAIEAPSTSSPQRGQRRSFPNNANIVTTASGIDIIDAATNKLWMRGSSTWSHVDQVSTTAKNGILYIGKAGFGFSRVDFTRDSMLLIHSDACYYKGNPSENIATQRTSAAYLAGCDYAVPYGGQAYSISAQVINGIQYFAVAMYQGVFLYNELTRQRIVFARISGHSYSRVVLTAGGRLYAANTTAGGVDIWTNVTADTSDQTGADISYTTSSTPALSSNAVNALSVTEGTSQAQSGSNTIAVGTDLGVNIIDEHSTQASSFVRNVVREGSTGTSGYNQKNFGGAMSFDGSNDIVQTPYLYPNNTTTFTIEAWVKPGATQNTYADILGAHGQNGSTNAYGFTLEQEGSTTNVYRASYAAGTTFNSSTTFSLTANVWQHLAVVKTSSSFLVFVDGVIVASVLESHSLSGFTYIGPANYADPMVTTGATNMMIGNSYNGGGRKFNGSIDEVRFSTNARYSAAFSPSRTPFVADSDTALLYHFDELNSQTSYDVSGNARNGTLGANSSVASDDPIRVIPAIGGSSDKVTAVGFTSTDSQGVLRFDGSNDYVKIPDSASLRMDTNFTLEAWVKTTNSDSGYQVIVSKWGNPADGTCSPGCNYILVKSTGAYLQFAVNTNNNYVNAPLSYINDGVWHHVAGVANADNSTLKLYIDGVERGSAGYSGNANGSVSTVPVYIGDQSGPSHHGQHWDGDIDDVRISNVARYTTTFTPNKTSFIPDANTAALYNFNEQNTQTVRDASSNANNGTLGDSSSSEAADPASLRTAPYGQSALWVATNGAGSNDGAVTNISMPDARQQKIYTTSNSDLPDLDVSSISMGAGGPALIGTEAGAWGTGMSGIVEASTGTYTKPTRINGNTRLNAGVRLGR